MGHCRDIWPILDIAQEANGWCLFFRIKTKNKLHLDQLGLSLLRGLHVCFVSFECLTQAKQSTRLQLKLDTPNTHSTQTQRYLAQLLPALLELTQLGLQHLSTLAITKKHAAATNFTPEQTKMCVWDRQSLIIDGWRRLDTKDAGRTLKECNRWFPKTGSKMT